MITKILILLSLSTATAAFTTIIRCSATDSASSSNTFSAEKKKKGRILVLGGSGFLGSNVAKRACLEGYSVTSLSRRGKNDADESDSIDIDYRKGDARDASVIADILSEGDYVAVAHCIGLLFDSSSGLGRFNRFVSGSGSVPEQSSTYDDITRITAFQAISEVEKYASSRNQKMTFIFTSAAEANWPNVRGGQFAEKNLAPEFLRRYLKAKREVEERLMSCQPNVRTAIFRPSLIYSIGKNKLPSLPAVAGFFVGNRLGLPFVDRPVTVQRLSLAMVRTIGDQSVQGFQGYREIDVLSK